MGYTATPVNTAFEKPSEVRAQQERQWREMYERQGGRVVKCSRRGSRTWWVIDDPSLTERGLTTLFIVVTLWKLYRTDVCRKEVTESMGPAELDCPLGFFELAPVQNERWRERVRQYHRDRRARQGALKTLRQRLTTGSTIRLKGGCNAGGESTLTVRSVARNVIAADSAGQLFRVKISQIERVDTPASCEGQSS